MPIPPPPRGQPPGRQPPKRKLSVFDETAAAPPAQSALPGGRLKVEDFDAGSAPPPTRSADPGVPVNKSSRAVNPKKQFPLHLDFLLRDLFSRGQVPEQWQIVAAEEARLDEMNWDVEFTLMDAKTSAVVRRVVEVQAGKLSRIADR